MSSEDSTQLSVAELLARNGQSTPSAGGRRRRGGRGISVADLTGDIAEAGESSHAAPDEPAPEPGYQATESGDEGESPLSGPISFYDPLSAGAQAPAWESPDGSQAATPPDAPMSRRARRELREALEPQEDESYGYREEGYREEYPDSGPTGRRHRPEPDEQQMAPRFPQQDQTPVPWAPVGFGESGSEAGNFGAPEYSEPGYPDQGPARGFAEPGFPGPGAGMPPGGVVPNGVPYPGPHPEPGMPPAPNGAPPPGPNFGPGRAPGGPGPGGLPAWSARRHPGAGAPDPGPRPFGAGNFGPENPESGEFAPPADEHGHMPRRGVIDLLDPSEDRTEYYEPVPYDATQHDYDASQQDYDDEYDGYDDEYDQYDDYDGAEDAEDQGSRRRGRRSGKRSLPGRGALAGRMALPSALSGRGSGSARGLLAAGRPSRAGAAEAGGRKQWLILAGQVIGASVLGMLLFKGFEQLWISMPTLALVLAMVVILGLVALVRVLRRTDDILSTVIAIVVGVFVTLGPLTFVLSAG